MNEELSSGSAQVIRAANFEQAQSELFRTMEAIKTDDGFLDFVDTWNKRAKLRRKIRKLEESCVELTKELERCRGNTKPENKDLLW